MYTQMSAAIAMIRQSRNGARTSREWAIDSMRKRGEPGAIVNILSINAHCGSPELAVYSATKGALATLTKNAANAHRFDRIRVNGINVGWTDTPAERVMDAGPRSGVLAI